MTFPRPALLSTHSFALLVFATVAPYASVALAGETRDYTTTDGQDGYGVAFRDDLLAGDGPGLSAPLLRVRPGATRATLLRPRTSFVRELCKSVEAL
jgi:hypothetical protein